MTPLVKALLAVALVIPLVAYVASTLTSTGGGAPEHQGTVYLDDVEPVRDATTETSTKSPRDDPPKSTKNSPKSTPSSGPTGSDGERPRPEQQGTDRGEARVVIPTPVGNDDDDDERDDDRDDTDDGDDSDD